MPRHLLYHIFKFWCEIKIINNLKIFSFYIYFNEIILYNSNRFECQYLCYVNACFYNLIKVKKGFK